MLDDLKSQIGAIVVVLLLGAGFIFLAKRDAGSEGAMTAPAPSETQVEQAYATEMAQTSNDATADVVAPANQDESPAESSSDQLWLGFVGGDGEGKCSLTSGGSVRTTPYIFVENGQGKILTETSNVVTMAANRVDNGAKFTAIFATSKALCEATRKQAN